MKDIAFLIELYDGAKCDEVYKSLTEISKEKELLSDLEFMIVCAERNENKKVVGSSQIVGYATQSSYEIFFNCKIMQDTYMKKNKFGRTDVYRGWKQVTKVQVPKKVKQYVKSVAITYEEMIGAQG